MHDIKNALERFRGYLSHTRYLYRTHDILTTMCKASSPSLAGFIAQPAMSVSVENMGRCPYCQNIVEELIAFSRMEAKQRTFLLGKDRLPGEQGLDFDASIDIPESTTWVDYQCSECEHILFRDYSSHNPPSVEVERMIVDFLAGRSSVVMKIPTDEELSSIARDLLEHKSGETLYHLSYAWIYGDLTLRSSLRTCYEETLVRLGKLTVVKE